MTFHVNCLLSHNSLEMKKEKKIEVLSAVVVINVLSVISSVKNSTTANLETNG